MDNCDGCNFNSISGLITKEEYETCVKKSEEGYYLTQYEKNKMHEYISNHIKNERNKLGNGIASLLHINSLVMCDDVSKYKLIFNKLKYPKCWSCDKHHKKYN